MKPKQILLKKTRLPLNEKKVLSLNIDGLSNKMPSLILGLIRDQEVFDLIKLQETFASDFNLPCYDSFHSEKVMDISNRQIHGNSD